MIQQISAAAAGTITLSGDLTVNRLGDRAMRITGKGDLAPRRTATLLLPLYGGPLNSE
jgi:predicted ATPase